MRLVCECGRPLERVEDAGGNHVRYRPCPDHPGGRVAIDIQRVADDEIGEHTAKEGW